MSNYNVPKGWKLVPVEPNEEIVDAIAHAKNMTRHGLSSVMSADELKGIYRAMLAAAPAAPVVQEGAVVMPTDAQIIEIARRLGALPELCNTEDHPDIRWRVNPEVRAMVREVLTLYAAPPAHPDAGVLSILRDARESVRYHKGMQAGHEAGKQHAAELAALIERIDAALAGKGGER